MKSSFQTWVKACVELGVHLEKTAGSGLCESITLDDVAKAASPAKPSEDQHGEVERGPLRGVRRVTDGVAKRVVYL
jgi:hypothetical protein